MKCMCVLFALQLAAAGCVGDAERGADAESIQLPHPPPKPPTPITVVEPLATGAACIIESDFDRLEVVVLQGHDLVHYWHDSRHPGFAWHRGRIVSSNVTAIAPNCLIQSDYKSGGHGNFEVVVQEGHDLVHYWHDNASIMRSWQRGATIATGVTGPGSITQSDFESGGHGDFEVVVPVGSNLEHYYQDDAGWHFGGTVAPGVSGPGAIIQGTLGTGTHGNLEVVAQDGSALVHYWHDSSVDDSRWQRGSVIATGVTGPGAIIQSDLSPGTGNFEVVVPVGSNLQHYWRDNTGTLGWQPGQQIADHVTGPGAIVQRRLKERHGGFEVVVPTGRASVQAGAIVAGGGSVDQDLRHYWHDNASADNPWVPAQTVTFRGRSEKICQLTGGYDAEWQEPTRTRTDLAGLEQTDLGYPVDDGKRITFLFGDSRPVNPKGAPESTPDDAVAWTTDTAPPDSDRCLALDVQSRDGVLSPPLVSPSILQGYYNVPSSGFATGAGLYGFFWTDHCSDPQPDGTCKPNQAFSPAIAPGANHDGRSVLAVSTDSGATFRQVAAIPRPFVYTASVNTDLIPDLPAGQKNLGVLVFGVPCYRQSAPYLALAPSGRVDDVSSWRYFDGFLSSLPWFGDKVTDATPVFSAASDHLTGAAGCDWRDRSIDSERSKPNDGGCTGELSVEWISPLRKWVMMYSCIGTVAETGVRVRVADAPWGPWSDPTTVFARENDGGDHGLCHFMHQGDSSCDDADDNGKQWGGSYAPYLLARYAQALPVSGGLGARLYFTMSTWNPYQSVVMRTDLMVPSK